MLFEEAEVQRNDYFDRETSVYTCLLDHFLRFDGRISPLLEETAMELSVADPLYRQSRRDAREDGRLCGDEP